MTVRELRRVADPYGKIEVLDADSCVTLACADESERLMNEYDDYEVDLLIAAEYTLRVYVYKEG